MDAAEILPQDLVFVDLETTGGNAAYHRITEVGIIHIENGKFAGEWSSLVNPECTIPSYIESFTGISNEMVADAPRFADIAPEVLRRLQGPVFVAHNARFDYSFLRSEFRRLSVNFSARVLCTVKLSRRLFPQHIRHNLDAVMQRHGLACSARHRALGDARVLRDFWFKLCDDLPPELLGAAAQSLLGRHKLPAHLPADLADDLPEGPGVYRFFAEDGGLLYVGKGASLRARVLAQLAGEQPRRRADKLAAQVRRVDWLETAGELGAALRESAWIKVQQPVYNRHVRGSVWAATLRMATATAAANVGLVEVVAFDAIEPHDLTECYGMFHSKKEALKALKNIAAAKHLCMKILGLEPGSGSCFAYPLGKCKGACVAKEPPTLHTTRLKLALSPLKLMAWPFPGRIALREHGVFEVAGGARDPEFHVLDQWTYLGTARCEEELAELRDGDCQGKFDAAVYKILARYLTAHPKLEWRDLRKRGEPRDQASAVS